MSGLVGAGLALGLLAATVQMIFDRFLSTVVLNQALLSPGDVWAISPYLIGGVIVLAMVTSTVTLWRYLRV